MLWIPTNIGGLAAFTGQQTALQPCSLAHLLQLNGSSGQDGDWKARLGGAWQERPAIRPFLLLPPVCYSVLRTLPYSHSLISLVHLQAPPSETQLIILLCKDPSHLLPRSYFDLYSPKLYYRSLRTPPYLLRIFIRQQSYRRHGCYQAGTLCPTVSSDSNRPSS
jgi:hypothetical protein